MEAYHDINDKDSNITQRAAARAQICEGLMSRSVNYKETWNSEILLVVLKSRLENEWKSNRVNSTLLRTAVLILIASMGKYVAPIC